jgi:Holliday junction resolvasome RuvABC endonuclease subunit
MVAQLLRLKTPPTPSDAADGVAVALTHLMMMPQRLALQRQIATLR